ncbi:hypothetical protein [Corallococcus exiguus]|nr:hypothetical protein [Corallococcus exiguus]
MAATAGACRSETKAEVPAAQSAGYAIVSEYNDLPAHYLLFLRPAVSP